MADIPDVTPEGLSALEASLLNTSGDVALHHRFRALFALKALKNEDAVRIISMGMDPVQVLQRHLIDVSYISKRFKRRECSSKTRTCLLSRSNQTDICSSGPGGYTVR